MKGHRLPDDWLLSSDDIGGYCRRSGDGVWECVTPNGRVGGLDDHQVMEHEDGTITVSPSILVAAEQVGDVELPGWHGYLEHGTWREC